jgi:hypothetical protein
MEAHRIAAVTGIVHVPLKPADKPAEKQGDGGTPDLTLDKLDIRVYRLGHHRVAMSATLEASYLDLLHRVHPRNREISLQINSKKKLDSQKSRLLSFGEIAVGRAPAGA